MPATRIKDIAVVATIRADRKSPQGEAPMEGEQRPPLTAEQRLDMSDRVFSTISGLMDKAQDIHTTHNKIEGSGVVDLDYVTRLSTNEFFFYTQEPLTIKEFESLQTKIVEKAKTLPAGIQLILGSFAVKVPGNQMLNVTPHITCGDTPSTHFLVKNFLSQIDVRYKEPDRDGDLVALEVLETRNLSEQSFKSEQLKVNIAGIPHHFTFNNVIQSKTPGGTPFLTAVDICVDHLQGVAKKNIGAYLRNHPAADSYPTSHVVISNSIQVMPLQSIGRVMHVDPRTHQSCKKDVNQTVSTLGKQPFSNDTIKMFELDAQNCPSLLVLADPIFIKIQDMVENEFLALKELEFGAQDESMTHFLQEKRSAINEAGSIAEIQGIFKELQKTRLALQADPATHEVRRIIEDFRSKASLLTIGMNKKADRIEKAMGKVSIEDRCHFLESGSSKEVLTALSSPRIFERKETTTFHSFKEKYQTMVKKDDPRNSPEKEPEMHNPRLK